jgi:hypothetical protein
MPETLKLGAHDSLEVRSSTTEAFEVEASYAPGGSPPPVHHHPSQDRTLDGLFREGGDVAEGREVDFGALLEEYSDVFRLDL